MGVRVSLELLDDSHQVAGRSPFDDYSDLVVTNQAIEGKISRPNKSPLSIYDNTFGVKCLLLFRGEVKKQERAKIESSETFQSLRGIVVLLVKSLDNHRHPNTGTQTVCQKIKKSARSITYRISENMNFTLRPGKHLFQSRHDRANSSAHPVGSRNHRTNFGGSPHARGCRQSRLRSKCIFRCSHDVSDTKPQA